MRALSRTAALVCHTQAPAGRETRRALAIYTRAAKLNHACTPSVAFRFSGSLLSVRTISDVPPGTPLRHSYGPQVCSSPAGTAMPCT